MTETDLSFPEFKICRFRSSFHENRFHVAVRLFSKTKKWLSMMFLLYWATWNLFVLHNKETNYYCLSCVYNRRWSIIYSYLSQQFKYTIFHIFICILHHLLGYITRLAKWPAPSWFDSSVGRALHQYRRGHGFQSRSGVIFFRAFNYFTAA